MEAEVRTETYGAVAVVDSVADGVNHKCLDLAEVTAEVTAVSADSQEWVAADMAVASEVDTECLRCLDLVEDSVAVMAAECRITEWVKRTNGSAVVWVVVTVEALVAECLILVSVLYQTSQAKIDLGT